MSRAASPNSAPIELKIVATEFKYEPSVLRVVAGQPGTLVVDNSQALTEHGIAIPALGMRVEVKAGEVAKKTVIFDKPGKYEFLCDLPGHTAAGMRGLLIVTT